jgi:hypothetical protein
MIAFSFCITLFFCSMLKQAARLACIPERTITSMLPQKYKVTLEEYTSKSRQVVENEDKKDQEENNIVDAQVYHTHFAKVDCKKWNEIIRNFSYSLADWYIEFEGIDGDSVDVLRSGGKRNSRP